MPETFDRVSFRQALGAFATGVTIVTAQDVNQRDIGLTANSFNSVSLDPPMVLWSLAKSSGLLASFMDSTHFGVHVLATDQEPLSTRFASRMADRFADLPFVRGSDGVPLIDGCSARFQCRTAFRYEGGDHIIFVGEVLTFEHFDRKPLLFHSGRYGRLMPPPDASATPTADIPPGGFGGDFLSWQLARAHFQLVGRLRPEIARHHLSDTEFLLLSALATAGSQALSSVAEMLRFMSFVTKLDIVRGLAKRGLLEACPEGSPDPEMRITESGRTIMVELMAAARAIEAEAESSLDPEERALLHGLLRKVIASSNPDVPALWRAL